MLLSRSLRAAGGHANRINGLFGDSEKSAMTLERLQHRTKNAESTRNEIRPNPCCRFLSLAIQDTDGGKKPCGFTVPGERYRIATANKASLSIPAAVGDQHFVVLIVRNLQMNCQS